MDYTPSSVRPQYDWKGNLVAYVSVKDGITTTIPIGNDHFDIIQNNIFSGNCILLKPDFKFASATVGRNSILTGHLTSVGFFPIDPNNKLRVELNKAIEIGSIEIRSQTEKSKLPHCSHIKFCVFSQDLGHI